MSFGSVAGDLALAHGASALVIAGGVGQRLADRLPDSGFRLVDRDRIEGIDLDIVRFAVPDGHSLARAQKRLAKLLPDAEVDADHIYFASGPGAALPAPAVATLASPGQARAGPIDGGVASENGEGVGWGKSGSGRVDHVDGQ